MLFACQLYAKKFIAVFSFAFSSEYPGLVLLSFHLDFAAYPPFFKLIGPECTRGSEMMRVDEQNAVKEDTNP